MGASGPLMPRGGGSVATSGLAEQCGSHFVVAAQPSEPGEGANFSVSV